jgi:FAD/FMN-containing dehydrogenase
VPDVASIEAVVGTDALDELRSSFKGQMIGPADAVYDEARAIYNAMIDRRPALILRPVDTADVIRAIGLARLGGVPLAVRGGGHSVAGFSTCDAGVVVDLSAMKAVAVDPERRRVRAQGGLIWGELDAATQEHGLATTGGRVSMTGVGGFTLGSGSGWLERLCGLAADTLVGAELVTADGEVLRVTDDENPELMWGLRGGGGNFGVVTEFEFALREVGPIVFGGLALFGAERILEVGHVWRDLCAVAPDEVGWALVSVTAPPLPFVPEEWHGRRAVGIGGMIAGDPAAAETFFAPIRALKPFVDLWQPMPYVAVQSMLDAPNPPGRLNYWRGRNLSDLPDEVFDVAAGAIETCPSPFTPIQIMHWGGAIERVGEDDTALSGRRSPFNVHVNGVWEGVERSDENVAWIRSVTDALPNVVPGISLNFESDIDDEALHDSFGTSKLARLRALKDRYDPENVFRLNQNIEPTPR